MNQTKGPWHANAIKGNRIIGDHTSKGWDKILINAHSCTVANVFRSKDAQLIASAPDLLEALKQIIDDADSNDPNLIKVTMASINKAKKAVAKATE